MNYPGSFPPDPRDWRPEDWQAYGERHSTSPTERLRANRDRLAAALRRYRCGSCDRRLRLSDDRQLVGFGVVTCRHADCDRDVRVDYLGCASQETAALVAGDIIARRFTRCTSLARGWRPDRLDAEEGR